MNCLVRILRVLGKTPAQVTRESDIPQSQLCTFAAYNKGMSMNKVIELADHLNISLDDLFMRSHREFIKIKGISHE